MGCEYGLLFASYEVLVAKRLKVQGSGFRVRLKPLILRNTE
jgi:hypothetical protein